jgi:fumarylacetoacetase
MSMQVRDQTHDLALRSWVESANDPAGDFPVQNLPYGVFQRDEREQPRIGAAIGDRVLDLRAAVEARALDAAGPQACGALAAASLNELMRLGPTAWKTTRSAVSAVLRHSRAGVSAVTGAVAAALHPQRDVKLLVPAHIGDYSDFYASLHHATNVGSMFRPDNPLMPNWKHLPVGYHGRASSIVVSGTPVRRPMGQTVADDASPPTFGPCKLLDYEMELGAFVGPGNELGTRIPLADAGRHLFGVVLVNDWSARDVQKWEYQPLGPFNAKNFATTIGPWVVTTEALAPFRRPGPPRGKGDPAMLDYLKPQGGESDRWSLDITVEVLIASQQMRERGMAPTRISLGSFSDMYWTLAQMLVHHTSTGCNMRPGDLIASGTISGPTEDSRGCLLERTWRGQKPITLADGTQRKFLQDGDEVILRGWCEGGGAARIGLGECRGIILPAQ